MSDSPGVPEIRVSRASALLQKLTRSGQSVFAWIQRFLHQYFVATPITFMRAFWPSLVLVLILFTRLPTTNYIFDEQEALLANPYVNQVDWRYREAIYRDFWGLPPNASIGSYRPLPNYLWRGVVEVGERMDRVVDGHFPDARNTIARWAGEDPATLPKLAEVGRRSFLQHFYNLFFHAVNGALFAIMAYRVSKQQLMAWLTGTVFVTAAILTEAVSGCVGIADVLGGLGALLALTALSLRLYALPFGVFTAMLIGLFSKESAVVCVPLVPFAALIAAPIICPERPARIVRAFLAAVGTLAAFIVYVELRKRWFPSPLPAELNEPLGPGVGKLKELSRDFLIWFHQAPLPKDPLNNPLAEEMITTDQRLGGALRVYFRGLCQVIFPWTLSGDYSFPQEPAPEKPWFTESVLGLAFTVIPVALSIGLWGVSLFREARPRDPPSIETTTAPSQRRRIAGYILEALLIGFCVWFVHRVTQIPPLPGSDEPGPNHIAIPIEAISAYSKPVALWAFGIGALTEAVWRPRRASIRSWPLLVSAVGMMWLVISYFPHSNIPVLLPTVRAERLWYFPVLGTTMVIGCALYGIYSYGKAQHRAGIAILVISAFLGFQAFKSYWHAMDYRDDLAFWGATKDAVPNSAKAHLNYSVMVGARGDMQTRLLHSYRARELAPKWAMAHVYTGDTLCRTKRAKEAWPFFKEGFGLGPNDKGLIALALQCLYDENELFNHDTELRALASAHAGSWIAYLAIDTLDNGEKNGGVAPEYRPRSYNEGPKKKKSGEDTVDADSESGSASASGSATQSTTGLIDNYEFVESASARDSASSKKP
jgi:protein O-mannosyl-transferase